jgi:hypothetical protein
MEEWRDVGPRHRLDEDEHANEEELHRWGLMMPVAGFRSIAGWRVPSGLQRDVARRPRHRLNEDDYANEEDLHRRGVMLSVAAFRSMDVPRSIRKYCNKEFLLLRLLGRRVRIPTVSKMKIN